MNCHVELPKKVKILECPKDKVNFAYHKFNYLTDELLLLSRTGYKDICAKVKAVESFKRTFKEAKKKDPTLDTSTFVLQLLTQYKKLQ